MKSMFKKVTKELVKDMEKKEKMCKKCGKKKSNCKC